MAKTQLLVIGAGPYALSTAACARRRGIETVVLGRPMSFWREHMPAGMFLRSGPDWHLDAAGVHTLEAFLEDRHIAPGEVDPIPVGLFLDYAQWFEQAEGIEVRDDLVAELARPDGHFVATLDSGDRVEAAAVVAAPGLSHFTTVPDWATKLGSGQGSHSCDLVCFDELSGARVLVVGGRQSAYEWAALIGEQGAERIDVVHRHDVPRFDKVSWKFVDEYVETTVRVRGWWRNLPAAEKDAIARRFWEVGRLTLEAWLTPRLSSVNVVRWPGAEVVEADARGDGARIQLSNGEHLAVDAVVFATGYKAELGRVPYLSGVLDDIEIAEGFPVLDEHFGTSLPGLYVPGFPATRDFGPFFGFVKGAPAAATLIVEDLLERV
ncbi:MAG TPA: FAD-dependent oxidoreductase [Acidimicrobiales bacterium]|nr:FAD-dependent oxidoreductase [Acidimicrobiales bacterium]